MAPRLWLAAVLAFVIASGGALGVLVAGDDPQGDLMLDPEAVDLSALDRVPAASWEALARKRIYFGHQSVGYDILAGIEDIARRKPQIRLKIVETTKPGSVEGPAFMHSPVGANRDPQSKIRDFVQRVKSAGPGLDVAFFKFCYVDITAKTPVEELFASYGEAMTRLAQEFPGTMFPGLTAPLTAQRTNAKARAKRLLGKPGDDADNRARQRFNDLLRTEYRGKLPFVDLAAAESTLPDGQSVTCGIGGDVHPCLARGYTHDGGHLNEVGRLVVARDLLLTLVAPPR